MIDNYSVKQINVEDMRDPELFQFVRTGAEVLGVVYDNTFNYENFPIMSYIKSHRFVVCFRGLKPVGFMLSRFFPSLFDPTVKILFQDSLFALPGTRAAKYLMMEFVDFGKSNADHIVSMIGLKTNIKRQTLEKLGFKELETLYRMEIKR